MISNTSLYPDFEGAQRYAISRLARELPPTLFYHSLWHTQEEVAARALWLAQQMQLSKEDSLLLETAVYFHDIGFVQQRNDHETVSMQIASETLPFFGFSPAHLQAILSTIKATRLPQSPKDILGQIIADADLDVLGRSDFLARNRALRAELATAGMEYGDPRWYREQIHFLTSHQYFTRYARETRQRQKDKNLLLMQEMLNTSQVPTAPLPNVFSPLPLTS